MSLFVGASIQRLRDASPPLLEPALRACIFTGPSLDAATARSLLPEAEVRAPIRRGDLELALDQGFRLFGVIDGTYIVEPTLSAPEVRQAIGRGAILYGAASLGALRAVEFRTWGFQGIGVVYDWYLRGVTYRDDEVVAAMDPGSYRALTDPTVNLRYACLRGQRESGLSRSLAERMLAAYSAYHFSERRLGRLFAELRPSLDATARAELDRFSAYVDDQGPALNIKRRDALRLLETLRDAHHLSELGE
jgi:hypothetical protein